MNLCLLHQWAVVKLCYLEVNLSMTTNKGHLYIKVIFYLLTITLMSSIAGTELFSNLLILGVLVSFVSQKAFNKNLLSIQFIKIGYEKIFIAIILVTFISLFKGGLDTERVHIFLSLRWILFFYVTYHFAYVYLSQKQLHIIVKLLSLIAIMAGTYAIYQHFTGTDFFRNKPLPIYSVEIQTFRSSGFFNNPMTFSHHMSMIFSFLFPFAFFYKGSKTEKILYLSGFILAGLGVFFSMTRGAWLSAFFSVFIVLAFRKFKLAFILLTIGLVTLIALSKTNTSYGLRIRTIGNMNYSSNLSRLIIWKSHLQLFRDNPSFGIGLNRNYIEVEPYMTKLAGGTKYFQLSHAHNTVIQLLAGVGFIGLIAFLAFFTKLFIINIRLVLLNKNSASLLSIFTLGALGAHISMTIGGLTEATFKDAEIKLLFIFLMALVLAFNTRRKKNNTT